MGRKALSIGVISFLGFFSAAAAGTYHQPEFSFFTSESNNYSPLNNYYATQQQPQQTSAALPARPVVRKHRGIGHTHTYIEASPIYVNKAPLYYPESVVFSEPLPIVPLPQLPSQFLTLNAANTGAYAGSENEVPKSKKSSGGKKGRRGKSRKSSDDAQETEADSDGAQGGYDSPRTRQRQQVRGRTGQRESAQGEGASGGYSSNLDTSVNSNVESGSQESDAPSSGNPKSRGILNSFSERRNRNRGNKKDKDNLALTDNEEEDQEEIMMTGDDAEEDDDVEDDAERNDASEDDAEKSETEEDDAEKDDAEEDEEQEVVEAEPMERGRSMSQRGSGKRGGKKNGKGKGRSRGGSSENDSEASLKAALDEEAQKLGTIYLPTFGNNVLNTVFPAYSQNALLRSLESQVGMGNGAGYAESGMDISGISIAADDDKKKSRKSRKRTSPRKNRPASSRGRSSSRRSKNRQASKVRAQEPNPNSQQQSQGGYSNPSQQQSQGNQGQNQQYGPPQFTPGNPSSEYGAPSLQQGGSRNIGISPPAQSGGEGGYRTINNELRPRTSDFPQFTSQQQSQQYGAPQGSQRTSFIEPRQISQATVVAAGNDNQFSSVADSNNPVTAELIRTVQAILQRYPN